MHRKGQDATRQHVQLGHDNNAMCGMHPVDCVEISILVACHYKQLDKAAQLNANIAESLTSL